MSRKWLGLVNDEQQFMVGYTVSIFKCLWADMLLLFLDPCVLITDLTEGDRPADGWCVGDVEHCVVSAAGLGHRLNADVSCKWLRSETHRGTIYSGKSLYEREKLWIITLDLLRNALGGIVSATTQEECQTDDHP